MKKTYSVRCMKTNGKVSYSVIDNSKIIFRCDRYSELVSFLKHKVEYFKEIGMLLIVKAPYNMPCLEEDVYSYTY